MRIVILSFLVVTMLGCATGEKQVEKEPQKDSPLEICMDACSRSELKRYQDRQVTCECR